MAFLAFGGGGGGGGGLVAALGVDFALAFGAPAALTAGRVAFGAGGVTRATRGVDAAAGDAPFASGGAAGNVVERG